MALYRPGIVAVIQNGIGLVLVCERSELPGAWQFPQGGIEEGESTEQAFFRELHEEIGNGDCRILRAGEPWVRYEWPQPGRDGKVGQEQQWFLGEFVRGEPDLARSDGCFQSWKWVALQEAFATVVDWKKPAYREGLESLGLKDFG